MFIKGSWWQREDGSSIILVCAVMVVLIGISALVVDVGRFYLVNHQLSNAADAAALAGARELPESSSSAKSKAKEYAEKNGIDAEEVKEEVKVQVNLNENTVTVTTEQKVPFLFGRIFTEEEALQLSKNATALCGKPEAVKGVAPLGIQDQNFDFLEKYHLKVGANEDYETGLGVGNFGALALGGGGSSRYEENLTDGYNEKLSKGDVVDTETGNMSNPTKRAIQDRVNNSYSNNPEEEFKICSRVLIIPVFEPEEESENQVKSIEIVGFAAFWVEEVEGQGNESEITGYFIKRNIDGKISKDAPDYGLEGVSLIN